MKRAAVAMVVAGWLAAGATAAAEGPTDPESEQRSFKVADGYEVNLYASEQDGIVKPVQMRWDARGRLWVACIPSYPQIKPGEQPDDRIVVLSDPGEQGRARKSSVFARGLYLPLGLEIGDGGVYAPSGNELLHLKDTDGDGVADERRVLFRGFVSGDAHQNINSLIWGPGGELMFCQGLHALGQVETPWGIERLDKAGVWRMWPRQMKLEPFLGNNRGPQNPWGVVFDDWGQPIVVAGNGQGVYYLTPAMILTDHFLDPKQIWDRVSVKFCGADILSGDHLPPEVRGLMATGSVMNNSVYWFRINEDGSGFRVKDLPPLLVSSDTRFRPVDVKVGPDGAIYVADWYNPIIGHYQASLRHPDRDKTHGRIWRITAKGRSLVKPPDLASMALPGLLDQLRSEERWTRYQVKRLLTDKDPKEVATALAAWVGHLDPADPRHEHLLFEALGAYETLEIVEPKLLGRVLAAKDYRARAFATSVIGHWQDRLADPIALLEPQARDESPRVRLEACVAASYVPSPRAIDVVLAAAERPTDRFIDYAVTQAVHALKPQWKPALDAGQISFAGHPERLRTLCKADGTADTVYLLVAMLKSDKAEGAFRDAILGLLAEVGGPEDLTLVLGDPRMKAGNEQAVVRVLRAMATSARQRKVKPAGDRNAALRTFLNSGDSSVRQAAVTLVGLWRVEGLRGEIEGVARDSKAATDVRRVAMEALADIGGKPAGGVLRELANGREPAEVRAAAVTAWARRDPKGAAAAAVRLMGGDEGAARVSDLVTTFLSRQGGAEALAAAVRETRIPVDAAKLALRTMSAAGRQDEPLRDALNAVVGGAVVHREYDADLVKRLAADALAHGDPAAGERVFRGAMTNCFACHSIGGAGGRVGPDLATVGTANPVELVIESVLWPNKQVKEGYTATLVETRGGDVYQGYLINQDPSGVALREPTTERVIRVAASDVKRKRNIGSLMPDGLVDALTQAEVRDLIRFLSELGKPGPYRVPEAPLVRTWQVLTSVPGGAAKLPPQEAMQVVWHAPASAWQPRYSTAGGELPWEDIAAAGSEGMRWVRFDVEVLRPGRFRLGLNSAAGLVLWLDGRGIKLGEAGGAEVEMGAGAREFMAGVDPARRGAVGLSFRIEPAAGSAGEVRLTTATTDVRGQ